MKRILTSAELLFTLLSILFYTGGPIFLLLSQGYSGGDSLGLSPPEFDYSLARNLFLLNYIITASLLVLRWKQVLAVLCREGLLIVLVGFAGLSLLWSVDPSMTQNRAIALIGTTCFGLYLASRFTLQQQCYLIASALGTAMVLSIAFALFLPNYGIMSGTHAGAWRGIYTHKNQLGKLMTLTIGLFALIRGDARSRIVKVAANLGLLMGMGLLILSQSTTGLIITFFLAFTLPLQQILRLRRALIPSLLLTAFFLISSIYVLIFNIETILGWFQKDLTLTGRTELWSMLIEVIARRPWLGYGFSGFWESSWDSPVVEVWRAVGWQAPSAHNSWVDIWLELGAIGFVLCVSNFAIVVFKAMKWSRFSRTTADLWPLTLLSCIFLNSLTESTLLVENDVLWVLYSAVAFTLAAQRLPSSQSKLLRLSEPPPINPFAWIANTSSLFSPSRSSSEPHTSQTTSRDSVEGDRPPHENGHMNPRFQPEHDPQLSLPQSPSNLSGRWKQQHETSKFFSPAPLSETDQSESTSKRAASPSTAKHLSPQPRSLVSSPYSYLEKLGLPSSHRGEVFSSKWLKQMLGRRFSNIVRLLRKHLTQLNFVGRAVVELITRLLRVGVQASYFVLLTRTLSVQEYGVFTSIVATVGLVAPFASLGADHLIVRDLARDRENFARFFGNALTLSGICSVMLTLVIAITVHLFLSDKAPLSFVLFIALSDLFFFKIIGISRNIFLTLEKSFLAAFINILMSLKNLLAIIIFIYLVGDKTIYTWGICYCLGTLTAALISVLLCTSQLGKPNFSKAEIFKDWKEGVQFSIGISAHFINSNIDKTMLLKWGTSTEVGIYAAAYRIISIAFTPIRSLMAISYAKFFSSGSSGLQGSLGFALKILPFAAGYGLLSSIFLACFSPLVAWIFGTDYADCVFALRWLSPLLFIQSIQFLLEDSLAGAGLQKTRSSLQVIAALVNIILNIFLLPSFSWRGAAWSSLASEMFLSSSLVYFTYKYYREEKTLRLSG